MDDQKQGYLFAFNLDGSPKWKTAYDPELEKRGPAVAGTRGLPTVDGDRVFLTTGFARLVIFDAAKGQVLKTVDRVERFGPKQAQFGFAESALVEGNKVICSPGGPDASVVALDCDTGDTLWQTKGLSQATGYCSARTVRHGVHPLVLTMLAGGVVAVNPDDGQVVWQHEYSHRAGVQPNPPLYADDMVYICSGMGTGGAMLSLAESNPTAEPKWADKTLDCQMQGVVVAADGMLYVYGVDGTMRLVKPNSVAYEPAGQFSVAAGTNEHWAHPTIANGRLYIRHGDVLIACDIKAGA